MALDKILFNIPEIIETPRLRLQMPQAGFGKAVHEAISDGYEDYIKWLKWSPIMPTVEAVELDCRKHHADFILRDLIRYIIFDKNTDTVLGRCAFPSPQVNWTIPQFGISYFIRQSERSKGYGSEATHAMALLAFRFLNAKKVEIFCDSENIASNKIPLKLGFELEYTQKGGWLGQNGALADLKTYSIFSEQTLPALDITFAPS